MGFMAPEVVSNNAFNKQPYDQKCDVFSMGIIFHMILMGNNPLRGKNYQQTYKNNTECNIELEREIIEKKFNLYAVQLLEGML